MKRRILSQGVARLNLASQTLDAIEQDTREQLAADEAEGGRFFYCLQILIDGKFTGMFGFLSRTSDITELVAAVVLKSTKLSPGYKAEKGDFCVWLRDEWNEDENPL